MSGRTVLVSEPRLCVLLTVEKCKGSENTFRHQMLMLVPIASSPSSLKWAALLILALGVNRIGIPDKPCKKLSSSELSSLSLGDSASDLAKQETMLGSVVKEHGNTRAILEAGAKQSLVCKTEAMKGIGIGCLYNKRNTDHKLPDLAFIIKFPRIGIKDRRNNRSGNLIYRLSVVIPHSPILLWRFEICRKYHITRLDLKGVTQVIGVWTAHKLHLFNELLARQKSIHRMAETLPNNATIIPHQNQIPRIPQFHCRNSFATGIRRPNRRSTTLQIGIPSIIKQKVIRISDWGGSIS
nr:hypothetical protein Iba_chr01aCG5890 [Ipomoea batatas]